MSIEERLDKIEAILVVLVDRQEAAAKEWLTTGEFARLVHKSEFTIRAHCRRGRVRAEKQRSGRAWAISRAELARYQQEGLLPVRGSTAGG